MLPSRLPLVRLGWLPTRLHEGCARLCRHCTTTSQRAGSTRRTAWAIPAPAPRRGWSSFSSPRTVPARRQRTRRRLSDPGHDGRCLAPRVAPEVATPFAPWLALKDARLPCFALETDFFQNPLTKVSNKMHIFAHPGMPRQTWAPFREHMPRAFSRWLKRAHLKKTLVHFDVTKTPHFA